MVTWEAGLYFPHQQQIIIVTPTGIQQTIQLPNDVGNIESISASPNQQWAIFSRTDPSGYTIDSIGVINLDEPESCCIDISGIIGSEVVTNEYAFWFGTGFFNPDDSDQVIIAYYKATSPPEEIYTLTVHDERVYRRLMERVQQSGETLDAVLLELLEQNLTARQHKKIPQP